MPSSGQRRKGPRPLAASASYTGEEHRQADRSRPAQSERRRHKHSDARPTPSTPGRPSEPDCRPHPTPDRRIRIQFSAWRGEVGEDRTPGYGCAFGSLRQRDFRVAGTSQVSCPSEARPRDAQHRRPADMPYRVAHVRIGVTNPGPSSCVVHDVASTFLPLDTRGTLYGTGVLVSTAIAATAALAAALCRRRLTWQDAAGAVIVAAGIAIFLTVSPPVSGRAAPGLANWLPVACTDLWMR